MDSILLKGGTIIDGTGAAPRHGDVLISGETITDTGSFAVPADARVIDCHGLAVAPGFIDSHSHSDLQVLQGRREKTAQGVTAEVVGNCGFSPYPAPPDLKLLHNFANGIFCGGDAWGWPTAKAYLDRAQRSNTTVFSRPLRRVYRRHTNAGCNYRASREYDPKIQFLLAAFNEGQCAYPGLDAPLQQKSGFSVAPVTRSN